MPGFRAAIYATEPALQFGRQLMETLIEHEHRVGWAAAESTWKRPEILRHMWGHVYDASEWQALCTADQLATCLLEATSVSFEQRITLLNHLHIKAVSSGFAIGAANWVLETETSKLVYLAASSTAANRHPLPLDRQVLANSDVCIVTSLRRYPTVNPNQMVMEMCTLVAATVAGGGSVLLPSFASGIVYDLLEMVQVHLANLKMSTIPIFFVSPSAKASLGFSNIFANWYVRLCEPRLMRYVANFSVLTGSALPNQTEFSCPSGPSTMPQPWSEELYKFLITFTVVASCLRTESRASYLQVICHLLPTSTLFLF